MKLKIRNYNNDIYIFIFFNRINYEIVISIIYIYKALKISIY